MRRSLVLVGLTCLLVVANSACGGATPSSTVVASPRATSNPSQEHAPPEIVFWSSYPATLLYALDAVAGERNRDPGYRAWLVDGPTDPPWLVAYAARRHDWGQRWRDDAGGGAPAFDTCAWRFADLDEVTECLVGVIGEGDAAAMRAAVYAADQRLRPRWNELGRALTRKMPALEAMLRSDAARELLATLRDEAQLGVETRLDFRVVLVAKPASDHSYARQAGGFLVHEVAPDERPEELMAVAFHEIAHLAHAMSPARAALEQTFAAAGDGGVLAGNLWDEVVASAFGNGLAAERFDPRFRADKPFYTDAVVSTAASLLHQRWRAGESVVLGPALARELLHIIGEASSAETNIAHYLWNARIFAESSALARAPLAGVVYRGASRSVPIEDALAPAPELPPWTPRIVLATSALLRARPRLCERLAIASDAWEAPLVASGAAVHRHDDPDGTMLLAVVATDEATLLRAGEALSRLAKLPAAGWTPLTNLAAP